MDNVERLSREVLVILRSPYTVCPKKLHDIAKTSSARDVEIWAEANTCQVDALVSALVEGLELWPFVLELIKTFASALAFRDTILRLHPWFLPSMLEKACSTEQCESAVKATCVVFLSCPLPPHLALPRDVPRLLSLQTQEAADAPDASSIQLLYLLLKGTAETLLPAVPRNQLRELQNVVLRLLKEQQDHYVQLLCLSVLAKLVSSDRTVNCFQTGAPAQSPIRDAGPESLLAPSRQFFVKPKAAKTLKLVCLRVVLCSASCGASGHSVFDCLDLSDIIIKAIDPQQRLIWAEENGALVGKMHERMLRKDFKRRTQLQILTILHGLTGDDNLLNEATSLARDPLSEVIRLGLTPPLSTIIPTLCSIGYLTSTVSEIARVSVDTRSTPQTNSITKRCIQFVKEHLRPVVLEAEDIRHALVEHTLTSNFRELLDCILPWTPAFVESSTHDENGCQNGLLRSKAQLQRELCLVLMIALAMDNTNRERNASHAELVFRALMKIEAPVETLCCSTFNTMLNPRTIPSVLVHRVGNSCMDSERSPQGWRTLLDQELEQNAREEREKVIFRVGAICRDLEARCEQVEAPLQEQKSIAAQLKNELNQCEHRSGAQRQQCTWLESENSRLQSHNADLEQQIQRLIAHVEGACDRLRDVEARHEEITRAKAEAYEQKDLETLANEAAREETIDQQARTITSVTDQLREWQSKNEALVQELHDTSTELSRRLHEAEGWKAETTNQRQSISQLERGLNSAEHTIEVLECSLRSLRVDAEQTRAASRERNTNSDCRIESLEDLLEKARTEYKALVERTEVASEELRQERNHTVAKLEDDLTRAHHRSMNQERQVADLERMIDDMRKEKQERAKEFAEAQRLSSRLMALTGYKAPPYVRRQPSSHLTQEEPAVSGRTTLSKQSVAGENEHVSCSRADRQPFAELSPNQGRGFAKPNLCERESTAKAGGSTLEESEVAFMEDLSNLSFDDSKDPLATTSQLQGRFAVLEDSALR